jgi:hypothetical protein
MIRVISISPRDANYGFFNIQVANHAAVSAFDMKNIRSCSITSLTFIAILSFFYKNMLYPNYNI